MIPKSDKFPIVLGHNDCQELNFILSNERILLIDYEYSDWSPMAWDLANYFIETMLDNSQPESKGDYIRFDNMMTRKELNNMATRYLQKFYQKFQNQ